MEEPSTPPRAPLRASVAAVHPLEALAEAVRISFERELSRAGL